MMDQQRGTTMRERIASRLHMALEPIALEVVDESAMHAGHAGARPGGETHFRVRCLSPRFSGKTRIERHRLVNEALSAEFAAGVHALALELKAPGET